MAEPPPDSPAPAPSTTCPDCGTVLAFTRLEGLCPVCLMDETDAPDDYLELPPAPASGPGLMHLPGYRLSREIARGGMGIIYEAVQLSPSRTVAIKMLLPHLMEEPAMRERFRREAQAMAGLDHAGILPVFEVGDHAGLPYFSMKLAAGGTLGSQAWRYRSQWRKIAGLIADLADAIQMAHAHGVLHRDLKPGNILFDDQERAYLSDFGIAKQLTANSMDLDLTKSATLLGTPNYLPPEWAAGTARSPTTAGDLYGLGAIFYQLLTGDPPHRAAQLTTLLRQIADDPVTPPREIDPQVPRDLEIIVLKALAKDPVHRYASAHELADDLRLWLAGRPIRARSASRLEKAWRWSRRNPLPAGLAAVLAVSLTVGSAVLWSALQTSRGNLHQALVSEASALRETGRLGNRTRALAALEQAIQLRPSRESQFELTSALAMTDLRDLRRIPYGLGRRVHTDAGLTRYLSADALGHIMVRRLSDNSILSELPRDLVDPHSFGPMSPDGRFICLRPARAQPFLVWDEEAQVFSPGKFSGRFPLFAADGRRFAVGLESGDLALVEVPSGKILAQYPLGWPNPRPYSFSPDGKQVVVGQFQQSRFAVIDLSSGRIVKEDTHAGAARVRCVVWRPDGSGFFIGTESFKIYEWTFTENSLPRQYVGHQGTIFSLAIHPGGEWLVSQSDDGTTRLWNTASAATVATLPFTGYEVRFSPDGRHLLCEDRANKWLHLLELVPSAVCRQIAIPHPDPDLIGTRGCWYLTFSPDGGLLSAADTEGLFHFDGHHGQLLHHEPLGFCWSLAWTPDGGEFYSVSAAGFHRRKAGAGRPEAGGAEAGVAEGGRAEAEGKKDKVLTSNVERPTSNVESVGVPPLGGSAAGQTLPAARGFRSADEAEAAGPEGRGAPVSISEAGGAEKWGKDKRLTSNAERPTSNVEEGIESSVVSRQSADKKGPNADAAGVEETPQGRTAPEWQLGAPELLLQEPPPVDGRTIHLNHMALSQQAPRRLGVALDDYVQVFDAAGQPDFQLPTPGQALDGLAFNAQGTLAAASLKEVPGVAIWDLEKKTFLHLLPTVAREATLRFHPDGQRLYTGDLRTLTLWHAASGKSLWSLPCPAPTPAVVQTALSPDGTLLAANLAPDVIFLLNAETGQEITRLRHPNPHVITGLAFSPDQSRLAVLCLGHLIQLWNLAQLRHELQARAFDWTHPPFPAAVRSHRWMFRR